MRGGLARQLPKKEKGGGKPFDNDTTTTKPTDGIPCIALVKYCPDGTIVNPDPSNDCKFTCPPCEVRTKKVKGVTTYYYITAGIGCDEDGNEIASEFFRPPDALQEPNPVCFLNGQKIIAMQMIICPVLQLVRRGKLVAHATKLALMIVHVVLMLLIPLNTNSFAV